MGMRTRSNIHVVTNDMYTKVYIDGTEVRGIRSMQFDWEPNNIPILRMELNALDFIADVECAMEGGADDREVPDSDPERVTGNP